MESLEGNVTEMPNSEDTSTKLQRIAALAQNAPDMAIHSLSHHIDLAFLQEAYRRIRKDGATGVDGQTWEEYGKDLEKNLASLLDRAKSGTYQAPPVRRTWIPKGDGKTRPLGIPTVEDKVLQKAVSMVMEAVYEQDFLDCSYGYRPKRSAHQALEALWGRLMETKGGWVIEVDIKGFFDNLVHSHLREILGQRIRDGVIKRLIGKWLNAGVMEQGELSYPDSGTPQGGVISPLLANIYLHHVLDCWWNEDIKPRLLGQGALVRFADDFVMVFENKRDADRMMEVLPKRFEKYGLQLHPDKTRMLEFKPRSDPGGDEPGSPTPRSFDFLGLAHYWGRSRRGYWVVKRKTAKSRLRRTLQRIAIWLRENLHQPVKWQHKKLSEKLKGHYAYFGITGNYNSLANVVRGVEYLWNHWLNRRSWRARMPWDKFQRLLRCYPLPPPRIVHSYLHGANP